ncbi:hypothetical protein DFQ28_008998 [Apophysomyces sp. BC1034]|nr:hypothetical protein DFQ30_008453 [Apophysomyces sp. BC1015]KAG0176811.1 hypothetical protein DFQ29_005604 [Apophysomyces sp. BC1021]KAG0192499.1 hypothetical protein DFQ28_008998 [Apophysomyces sp. BC1034]
MSSAEWTLLEKLLLTQAIYKHGEDSWFQIARKLKQHPLIDRHAEFFNQKTCSFQYYLLVEELEAEKRQVKTFPSTQQEMPTVVKLAKQLYTKRVEELQNAIRHDEDAFMGLVAEIDDIRSGRWDTKLENFLPITTSTISVENPLPSATSSKDALEEELATATPQDSTSTITATNTTELISDSLPLKEQQTCGAEVLQIPSAQPQDASDLLIPAPADITVNEKDEKSIMTVDDVAFIAPPSEDIQDVILNEPTNVTTTTPLDAACEEISMEMNLIPTDIALMESAKQIATVEQTDLLVSTPLSMTQAETPQNTENESNHITESAVADTRELMNQVKMEPGVDCVDIAEDDAEQTEALDSPSEPHKTTRVDQSEDAVPRLDTTDQGDDHKYGSEDVAGSTYASPSTMVQSVGTSMDMDSFDHLTGAESNGATPTAMTPTSSSSSSDRKRTREEQRQKSWQKNVNLLWQEIANHKNGTMFMNPIKETIAPRYYDVVRQPMDLKTIKNRVRDGVIKTTMEFERDIVLMLTNSLMYNKEGTEVYQMAHEMLGDALEQIRLFKAADSYSSASAPARKKATIR